MVADEVMAGFGRTGRWFAIDHWDTVPDLMTMAKGLTSSYLPLGAVGDEPQDRRALRDELLLRRPDLLEPRRHCAAALANIGVYEEDGLIENAARLGAGDAPPPRGARGEAPVGRAPTATSGCSGSSTSSGAATRGRR